MEKFIEHFGEQKNPIQHTFSSHVHRNGFGSTQKRFFPFYFLIEKIELSLSFNDNKQAK